MIYFFSHPSVFKDRYSRSVLVHGFQQGYLLRWTPDDYKVSLKKER